MKNEDDNGAAPGKIITFAHASGGVGATTLAVNAATLISAAGQGKKQTACLLDLDLQFGGAAVQMDIPGHSPVTELLSRPERLDQEMFEGTMIRHGSGLRVLTTPETPLPMDAIGDGTIRDILQLAQKNYKYVVVDMPQTMTSWTDAVYRESAVIYAVMQMNVSCVRQMERWFSVMDREGLRDLTIRIVANRYSPFGLAGQSNITLAQAEKALGHKVDFTISNDYELISQSLDEGMPAVSLYPKGGFAHQMKTMLQETVDEIEVPGEKNFLGWKY